jgi:hypothetical protein
MKVSRKYLGAGSAESGYETVIKEFWGNPKTSLPVLLVGS